MLPSRICRQLGADFVIGSDVWELSSALRSIGVFPHTPSGSSVLPFSLSGCTSPFSNLLIQPRIPALGMAPVEHPSSV